VTIPSIETERLVLRAHRVEDLDDCVAMWADPIVTRFIGGRAFSREDTWSKLLRYAGHWALLDFGYWVICDRTTNGFVGEVGFADFKRELEPSISETPEIGWALAPAAHGKGLATEAVRAALQWGDDHFGKRPTVCLIDPSNAASLRVASKCGYQERARMTYKNSPTILFERR
jgi:RimJ/RimL family protein N-acetyltransferase